jgi:thiol-disulfide isomerase/thioredoxin
VLALFVAVVAATSAPAAPTVLEEPAAEGCGLPAEQPDLEISDPIQFGNRLRCRYRADPVAALAMLRHAMDGGDMRLERRAVRWLHEELALNYAPANAWARVREPAYAAFLASLGDARNPTLAGASAGLRLWVRALDEKEPVRLPSIAAGLADVESDDASIDRYRILIAARFAAHAETRSAAIVLLEAAVANLESALAEEADALDAYRLAYAHYALGLATGTDPVRARREFSAVHVDAGEASRGAFFYERLCLAAPEDLEWAAAEALLGLGATDDALRMAAPRAIADAKLLPALREMHAKARPGEAYSVFWARALEALPAAPPLKELQALRGKWVLVDFWGTWCAPCVEEMPKIDALAKEFAAHPKARVLTIACNDDAAKVGPFMKKNRYSFPVVLGQDDTEVVWGVGGFPSRRLVTPGGRVIVLGADWQETFRAHVANDR